MFKSQAAIEDRYILVPRKSVTGVYLLHFLLGVEVAIWGSPTLASTSPKWWIPLWSAIVIISSAICAIASLRSRLESLEKWSCIALVSCFITFPISAVLLLIQGNIGRAALAIVLVIAAYLPTIRLLGLIRRGTGRRND